MACAAAELNDADRALEVAWRSYQKRMREVAHRPPDGGTYAPSTEKAERQLGQRYLIAIEQAHSRFRAFRDAQCFTEGFSMRGGTGSDDPIVACRIRLDKAQTAHLAELTKALR
jgi:uncharacterized protein YecT (DUF1311 family)